MTESGPIAVREGELIAGKYRVEGVIGVGGMGVVVSARHEQLDQRVAIKLVREQVLRNPEAVQRFLREARAAAKLKSDHAARVLDVGTLESGVPYMVMEFLEGADLAQMLEQQGPLPVDVAADWVAQACEALAEAHAAGIIHRDLKPQNLFLARTVSGAAKVKVLDFGVSKSAEAMTNGPAALTRTRSMLGSPLYMAPEQMRSSRDVDARADVWALGVVLFELLTRRLPFEAETLPELCLKVVSEPPLLLSTVRPEVPATMCQIVARCLEKDRENRFANAAELAAALGPLVPPGSRLLVERAQWVAASVVAGSPQVPGGASRSGPSAQRSPVQARAGTPSAWGSKGDEKQVSKRNVVFWVGAVVLAGVGALGVAVISRSRDGRAGSRPELTSPTGATSSISPPVQAASAPTESVAVVTLPPLPTQVPPAEASAIAAAASASTSASVHIASVASAPAPPAPPRVVPARPAAPTKATVRDDDIPALR